MVQQSCKFHRNIFIRRGIVSKFNIVCVNFVKVYISRHLFIRSKTALSKLILKFKHAMFASITYFILDFQSIYSMLYSRDMAI